MSQLSEEQREQLKQTRERQLEVAVFPDTGRVVPEIGTRFVVTGITRNVLDFHDGPCTVVELSLLDSDSQATALDAKEIVDQFEMLRTSSSLIDVEVSYGYLTQAISALQTRASTAMRDKCVETVSQILSGLMIELSQTPDSYLRGQGWNSALARANNEVIPELESLTLDQVRPGEM